MAFLTGWRLALAADRLAEGASVGAAAREVGYGSAYALSTAFKRVRGVSPRDHSAATGYPSRRSSTTAAAAGGESRAPNTDRALPVPAS